MGIFRKGNMTSSNQNGNVKWWQLVGSFLTLLAIFSTMFVWGANQIIDIDKRRQNGDELAAQDRIKLREDIVKGYREISEYMHRVDTRLTSIETFLNPKKVSPDKMTYVPGYYED